VPIYDLNGDLIAIDANNTGSGHSLFADNNLVNSLAYDVNGTPLATYTAVWTGTSPDGTPNGRNPLGDAAGVNVGYTNTPSEFWISHDSQDPYTQNRLYAISDIITVPTPEPGTIGLMTMGAAFLLCFVKRNGLARRG
jgi:hypothetical protein